MDASVDENTNRRRNLEIAGRCGDHFLLCWRRTGLSHHFFRESTALFSVRQQVICTRWHRSGAAAGTAGPIYLRLGQNINTKSMDLFAKQWKSQAHKI